MMLGLSPDAWGAIGTIAGTVGVGASAIYSRIASGERRAHELEMSLTKKEFDRVDASLKASWVILDDLRFNSVRKQDQDRLRDEFRADMKILGDRLEAAITALREDIHRGTHGGA